MYVIKISGKREKFNPVKVRRTCLRAGASPDLANSIVREVIKHVYNGMETRELLKLILKLLKQKDPIVASRYSLKKAMLSLGPTGFVFEEFMVSLLKAYGYQAWCPPLLKGICVKHEVDIIAKSPYKKSDPINEKESSHSRTYMIECKYHNTQGLRSGLKEALYVWARFLDLRDAWRQGIGQEFHCPWLISNTKFSTSAIKYAQCKGLRLLGWKYPRGNGLEYLIENKKLYPVTILRSLDQSSKKILFSKKIILCQDLISIKKKILKQKTMLKDQKLTNLIKEASLIIRT